MAEGARRREDALTEAQFLRVREIARTEFGMKFPDDKRPTVELRLSQLKDRWHARDAAELLDRLAASEDRGLMADLFEILSTPLTMFFREQQHFDVLLREVLLPYGRRAAGSRGRLRIWSAACSIGCEPYSIAMHMTEAIPGVAAEDAKILATDLSRRELASAKHGVYPPELTNDVSPERLQRFFEPALHRGREGFRVRNEARELVTFASLNLKKEWRMRGPFDAIFCRNVLMYFDEETRADIVERACDLLREGGILFLGTSEPLSYRPTRLSRLATSVFQKHA